MVFLPIIFISLIYISFLSSVFTISISPCTIELVTSTQQVHIINNGNILPSWQTKTADSYMANQNTDIEYFYLIIFKSSQNSTSEDVTATLVSNDTVNSDPKIATIKSESKFNEILNINEPYEKIAIEVMYNCKEKAHRTLQMTMTLQILGCDKIFKVQWEKLCIPREHYPAVNIGLMPNSNDIMQAGKFGNSLQIETNSENKLSLPKEVTSLTLYMSYSREGKSLMMHEPSITLDHNALTIAPNGVLKNGGLLTNKVQQLTFIFSCNEFKVSKTDVQITLSFSNFDIINLFFSKECDQTGEINEYFTIFVTIYWILLFLIGAFVVVIIMYYLKKTNTTLAELFEKILEKIKNLINRIRGITTKNKC